MARRKYRAGSAVGVEWPLTQTRTAFFGGRGAKARVMKGGSQSRTTGAEGTDLHKRGTSAEGWEEAANGRLLRSLMGGGCTPCHPSKNVGTEGVHFRPAGRSTMWAEGGDSRPSKRTGAIAQPVSTRSPGWRCAQSL